MNRRIIHFLTACSAIMAVVGAAITAQVLTDYLPAALPADSLTDAVRMIASIPGIDLLVTAIISAIMLSGIADFWRRDLAKLGR